MLDPRARLARVRDRGGPTRAASRPYAAPGAGSPGELLEDAVQRLQGRHRKRRRNRNVVTGQHGGQVAFVAAEIEDRLGRQEHAAGERIAMVGEQVDLRIARRDDEVDALTGNDARDLARASGGG